MTRRRSPAKPRPQAAALTLDDLLELHDTLARADWFDELVSTVDTEP